MSTPYLLVSCAITINSLYPCFANSFASSRTSSIFLLTNFPLIYGIAQYVHLLLHPSAILKYAKFCPVVITLFENSKLQELQFEFFPITFSICSQIVLYS